MDKIVIDPLTRVEGHLKVEAIVDGGEVKEARCIGTMFRGFELFLKDRDPRDASRITQRVCGVCPTGHATASALCLDSAFGVADKIPENGRIIRNLILGSNYLQSHILHFYHLAALDYVDVTAAADYEGDDPDLLSVKSFLKHGVLAPFVPRYEGDYRLSREMNRAAVGHYVKALHMRRLAHEMLAVFGGKMPHSAGIVVGGVTSDATVDRVVAFMGKLKQIREFIDNYYIPDVLAVAGAYSDYFEIGRGCGKYLAYGAFDLDCEADLTERRRLLPSGTATAELAVADLTPADITENVKHSWFDDSCSGHPSRGDTAVASDKEDGYSWIKSPRYEKEPYEVGPLARYIVAYLRGEKKIKEQVDGVLSHFSAQPGVLFSTLGRHAARALETKLVADTMEQWLLQIKPGEPVCADYQLPRESEGVGLVDAPRGALGHWIKVRDGVIGNYQLVVPTTWNCGPTDEAGRPGPCEQALIGTKIKDRDNPFEIVRIVRSFDPCLACAVHVVTPKGRMLGKFRIA